MPRGTALSELEWEQLLALPTAEEDLVREYTFTADEMALIRRHRGDANRFGFAVQLAYCRYPGIALGTADPAPQVLQVVAEQLGVQFALWADYGRRDETRREHAAELRATLGMRTFTDEIGMEVIDTLADLATQTDNASVIAAETVTLLRAWNVFLPAVKSLDEVVATASTRGNTHVYAALTEDLTNDHRRALDRLLRSRDGGSMMHLTWLRQSPLKPNSRAMREHLDRLRAWRGLELPHRLRFAVRRNRLLKLAREGGQMTVGDLAKFEPRRRYATLVALALESQATVIDEVIDLRDRIMGKVFNQAKNRHKNAFRDAGKDINDKVRLYGQVGELLVEARQSGTDPFAAIDAMIGWDVFARSVVEAKALSRPKDFDSLPEIRESYSMLRRYTPDLLDTLRLRAAPAGADLLAAVDLLRRLNQTSGLAAVPPDAPTSFIGRRWARVVRTQDGLDRAFYEMCVLAELRNALRSGDIWVEGSRQYKDFDDYLLPAGDHRTLPDSGVLPASISGDADDYLDGELAALGTQLIDVEQRGVAEQLPGVSIAGGRLRIEPADTIVPPEAEQLIARAAAMMPRVPITDMLVEVNNWTGFTDQLTHLKTGDAARDNTMLLTVVLADGINLGLTKMTEACAGATYAKMLRLQAMHIRDDTYQAALATIVNAQHRQPFAIHFGDGTTSSSDGQRFRTGNSADTTGHVNPKYGSSPGRLIYTHISDQYAPFHSALVNVGVRDATHVIDGLLDHETDLEIHEHYTDTAGYTDHVFALTHFLGFRFAPRIRDLAERSSL